MIRDNKNKTITLDTDIREPLHMATSYKAGNAEEVNYNTIFDADNHAAWYNEQIKKAHGDLSGYLKHLHLGNNEKTLTISDNDRCTDKECETLEEKIKDYLEEKMISAWNEAHAIQHQTTIEQKTEKLKKTVYKFMLSRENHTHYPHKDQHFWGDEHDKHMK